MSVFSLFFDEFEGQLEILRDVFVESVFECETEVLNMMGEFEVISGK